MKRLISELKLSPIKNALIIGDIMLDEYIFGQTNRISPEAPIPVVKVERSERSLGGAANVADNCRLIGFNVQLVGVIGNADRESTQILEMLQESSLDTNGIVKSSSRVTTCKQRIMSKSHQMLRIDCEDSVSLTTWEQDAIMNKIDILLKPHSIILISDYAKGVVTPQLISYVVQKARQLECIVMVDPKGPHFDKYQGVDYIKPNFKEFCEMLEFFGLRKEEPLIINARKLCAILSLQGIVITLGEKGIVFVSPTECIESPSFRREVHDITGAGDTVFAFLALGIAHKRTLHECLKLANAAAAVAVSHLKTYAVSLDELVDPSKEATEKIFYDWAKLKIELDWLRSEGRKIVFTNGCFDILHAGHIHILTEAKRFGDTLVVALNSDDSIKQLKGKLRPIFSLEDRMALIAALGAVDFVVSFPQNTPAELLEYLRPDVLVKGGDYKVHEVVGYDLLTSYGGSVQIVDLIQGKSTTNALDRLAQKS